MAPHRSNRKGDLGNYRPVSSAADIDNIFLTEEGWVYRHFKGNPRDPETRYWDEIIVAGQVDRDEERPSRNPIDYGTVIDNEPMLDTLNATPRKYLGLGDTSDANSVDGYESDGVGYGTDEIEFETVIDGVSRVIGATDGCFDYDYKHGTCLDGGGGTPGGGGGGTPSATGRVSINLIQVTTGDIKVGDNVVFEVQVVLEDGATNCDWKVEEATNTGFSGTLATGSTNVSTFERFTAEASAAGIFTIEATATAEDTAGGELLDTDIITDLEIIIPVEGGSWIPHPAAENNSWKSVTYGAGKFVAVAVNGTNSVMTSVDGETWVAITPAVTKTWQSVTYGDGKFVAVAERSDEVMTSPDGENWTGHSVEYGYWTSVTYGAGKFVAVAGSGSGNRVMTSVDGETWTSYPAAAVSSWSSVTYGNGKFVAVANGGNERVMTSVDGENWTAYDSPDTITAWNSVTYGDGKFVAVAKTRSNRVMTSVDGEVWENQGGIWQNQWTSVAYGNGKFVAVADCCDDADRVLTSVDGEVWEYEAAAENNSWAAITYGGGKFVALADTGVNRVMTHS